MFKEKIMSHCLLSFQECVVVDVLTQVLQTFICVFKLWSLSWTNCAMTPFSKEKKWPHLCFFCHIMFCKKILAG